jgi:hypothetical protein
MLQVLQRLARPGQLQFPLLSSGFLRSEQNLSGRVL